MNRFVRCPGCSAIYKVVPDQLKIAGGWLKCGQCQLTFDSTGLVLAWPETSILKPDPPSDVAATERLVIDEFLKQEDQSTSAETASATGQVQAVVGSFEAALSSFKPLPSADLQVQELSGSANSRPPDGASAAQAKSVIRQGRWAKWLKLSAAALFLGLVLQWLWVERQMLAASEPLAAKALDTVCRNLGCDVLPLQVSGGIAIESSNLLKQDNGFQLNWSLRNVTSQTLQMPALELTLLNAEDRALVRRTLLAAEIGAPAILAPGENWQGQLSIFPQGDWTPTGYRLLNFYP